MASDPKDSGSGRPINCWEFKKCGREPGGRKVAEAGVCPSAIDQGAHGINHGINGGRYCWKVSGTICDDKPQHDLEAKRINCMMCDFYKLVEKEEGSTFRGVDEEHTEDKRKIAMYFETALKEEKLVEVRLDDKVRTFFTRIKDHPPEPIPKIGLDGEPVLDETGEPVTITPFYQEASYIGGRGHILIDPLVPALGNVQIRSCTVVHLRFFEGIKAFETQLAFQGTLNVQGEPAIQLSFPDFVSVSRKRAFFRVTIPQQVSVEIRVDKKGFAPAVARMLDISPGGISFCHQEPDPAEMEKETEKNKQKNKGAPEPPPALFEKDDHISVTITPKDLPGVTMPGFVRNKVQGVEKSCRGRLRMICGLQFDVSDRTTENRLLEVVSYYQRMLAQSASERRHAQEKAQKFADSQGQGSSSKELATRELLEEKSRLTSGLKRILS